MTAKTSISRADMTRASILSAARSLFIENGFGGTSMGKIAALAKVNHSLLFHHFDNKQNLWQEVKKNILEEGKAALEILPSFNKSLSSFLRELMEHSIEFYHNNPDLVRMTSWQRLERDADHSIGLAQNEETEKWLKACQHFQKTGEIDSSLKPEFIMTIVLSIVSSMALDPNVYIKAPEDRKAYIDFSVQFLEKALK